jgi:F-type H+-transporting ATPase subunit epsilon
MPALMQVEVVSPDEELFSGEATFVLARTVEGDIGILANHSPLLAELAPYDVKIHAPGGDVHFPIAGGFMSVKDNKVIILAAGALEV